MKSKAEVLESLRWLVRTLLDGGKHQREQAFAIVATLADDLCDDPTPKRTFPAAAPVAPKSWSEEREALLAENKRLRLGPECESWLWEEWARTVVGGIGLTPDDLFERTKKYVATILKLNQANERTAVRAIKVLTDYRRAMKERGELGPFHGAEVVRARDLLSRIECEQLGHSYDA